MSSTCDGVGDTGDFAYETLANQPSDTIRLVLLVPGSKDDIISCELVTTQTSKHVKFAALSYVWGKQHNQKIMLVNGKELRIGTNLWNFLSHVRHPTWYMTLWVDAICINQDDLIERGHQVRLMGEIYRKAHTVFAWLGKDTHNVRSFLGTAETQQVSQMNSQTPEQFTTHTRRAQTSGPSESTTLTVAVDDYEKHNSRLFTRKRKLPDKAIADLFPTFQLDGKTLDSDIVGQSSEVAWLTFENLCKRNYWSRMWIVQELLLARSIIVCVGDVQISWEDFSGLIEFWSAKWKTFIRQFLAREVQVVQGFVDMTKTSATARDTSLELLLGRYWAQECLDSRDKVYALLPLVNDCNMVEPNYEKSRLELFFELRDIVNDHSLLRSSLGLYADEIKYRAEMLHLQTRELDGHICILPELTNGIPIRQYWKRWHDRLRLLCLAPKREYYERVSFRYAAFRRSQHEGRDLSIWEFENENAPPVDESSGWNFTQ